MTGFHMLNHLKADPRGQPRHQLASADATALFGSHTMGVGCRFRRRPSHGSARERTRCREETEEGT
jgi:hypothetical protein